MAKERFRCLLAQLLAQAQQSLASVAARTDGHEPPWSLLKGALTELIEVSEDIRGKMLNETPQSWLIASEFLDCTKKQCESVTGSSLTPSSASVLVRNLTLLTSLLQPSLSLPDTDLLNLEKSHPRWRALWEKVESVKADDEEAMESALQTVSERFRVASASFSAGLSAQNPVMRGLLTGSSLFYYSLFRSAALEAARQNAAEPSVEYFRLLLGIVDSQLASKVYNSLLAPVAVSQLIYVPRAPRNSAQGLLHSGVWLPPMTRSSTGSFSLKACVSVPSVPIRVISPYPLPSLQPAAAPSKWSLCCSSPSLPEPLKQPEKLILHIHGGGWICMSSHTHENYTRKWAIGTDTVVLSVEYRLAPEFPYPHALNDVWDAYMWALKHAKHHLGEMYAGVDPKKVIVAGDSAGGNLALALTLKALQMRVRPPDGLLLVYPALCTDLTHATPSYLFSFEDTFLTQGMMVLCGKSYVPTDSSPRTDPLLSPLFAPDELLRQLPPVRLMIGTKDPVIDDCWRLFEKLISLGNDVKMSLFDGFPHGALNLDVKFGLPQAQKLVTAGCQYLKELLYLATRR